MNAIEGSHSFIQTIDAENKDISVTNMDKVMTFSGGVLHVLSEEICLFLSCFELYVIMQI